MFDAIIFIFFVAVVPIIGTVWWYLEMRRTRGRLEKNDIKSKSGVEGGSESLTTSCTVVEQQQIVAPVGAYSEHLHGEADLESLIAILKSNLYSLGRVTQPKGQFSLKYAEISGEERKEQLFYSKSLEVKKYIEILSNIVEYVATSRNQYTIEKESWKPGTKNLYIVNLPYKQ